MPSSRSPHRPGRIAGLVLVAVLLAFVAATVLALRPPAPAPADAPAGEFSSARAFEQVELVAAEPHVAGSEAGSRVVDHLVDRLTQLGLDTRVQNAVGAGDSGAGAAELSRVRNVVAVLPGTDPTGRLFLMAHHDSVVAGPGAADDASGVATLLETVRALTEGPALRNDVVVVLTDAEEACLCGAEAFAAAHPLAGEGGVVLNFEARGTTGPPIMFETSLGNADLAGVFADAAPHPVASSFAVEVYRALPNDTDFSVLLRDGGFTGMNSAFIDGAAGYHSPQDTPENLDRGTLQAMGGNALALTRALGDADLAALDEPGEQDATYFPVLGRLVSYPGSLVWPLAIAALVAVAGFLVVLVRRGTTSSGRTAAGTGLALLPLVLAPLGVQALWEVLVRVRPGYADMIDPWRPGWFRLAAVALVAAVVLTWYALLRRRIGGAALVAGTLVWSAVLAAVLAVAAPGGSYLAAWPALVGALTGIVVALAPAGPVRLLAALVSGAVAAAVLAPTVALFFPALGLSSGAAPGVVATLLALALLPAAELLFPDPADPGGRGSAAAVPAAAFGIAVACAVVGLQVDRFDARTPVPSHLAYALDTDSGTAWWASRESSPGDHTAGYVDRRGELPVDFPYLAGRELAIGSAEVADLQAPAVTVLGDAEVGGRREVTVEVTPRRSGVRLVALEVRAGDGTVSRARVEGRAVPERALGRASLLLTLHAPRAEGATFSFTVEGDGPVELRAVDGSTGLAGLPGHRPRPEGVDAAGSNSSDLVLVSGTTAL